METLYLHIGTHKTGTTAIQHFCETNKKVLAQMGYCYPIFPRKYKGIGIRQNGHFIVGSYPRRGRSFSGKKINQYTWRIFMHHIKRLFRKYPNIILSDELIWSETKFSGTAMWKKLKEEAEKIGFEIRVIIYLRRQDEFLCSIRAERIKNQNAEMGVLSWEETLTHAEDLVLLDYYKYLEKIAEILGRDQIIVKIYERERFKEGDVRYDFLETIGLSFHSKDFVLEKGTRDPNPSLAGNVLEIKRVINTIPNSSNLAQKWLKEISINCFLHQEGTQYRYSMISQNERDELLKRYEESNRCVARDYLHQGDIPLFSPPKEMYSKWAAANPYMYEDIIRFFGEAVISIYNMQKGHQVKERILRILESARWLVSIIYDYLFIM